MYCYQYLGYIDKWLIIIHSHIHVSITKVSALYMIGTDPFTCWDVKVSFLVTTTTVVTKLISGLVIYNRLALEIWYATLKNKSC